MVKYNVLVKNEICSQYPLWLVNAPVLCDKNSYTMGNVTNKKK
jgi:hypothetical protein